MKNIDSLTKEELGRLFPVIISQYKDEWKNLFIEEKKRIIEILGQNKALRVEHIGSTAIPGLLAKPTIDILVEIPAEEDIHDEIKQTMSSFGYIYMTVKGSNLLLALTHIL